MNRKVLHSIMIFAIALAVVTAAAVAALGGLFAGVVGSIGGPHWDGVLAVFALVWLLLLALVLWQISITWRSANLL